MLIDLNKYLYINIIISIGIFLLLVENITKYVFTTLFIILFLFITFICVKGIINYYKVVGESEETYNTKHPGYWKDNYILILSILTLNLVSVLYLYWDEIEKNNTRKNTIISVIGVIYILLFLSLKLYLIYYIK